MTSARWNGATGVWETPSDWSTGATPTGTDAATIDAAGTYTVTIDTAAAAQALLLAGANATLDVAGTLTLGGTLAVQSGTLLAAGDIVGGTIAEQGGTVAWAGGTLDGVAVAGILDLSAAYSSVGIRNGLAIQPPAGTIGTVSITGLFADIAFLDSETIDNALLLVGSNQNADTVRADAGLVLGAGITLDQTGTLAQAALEGPGAITNYGTLRADPGDELLIRSGGFTNRGSMTVASGGTLLIEPTTVTSGGSTGTQPNPLLNDTAGSIIANAGGSVVLDPTSFTNNGTITANGGVVSVFGTVLGNGLYDIAASGQVLMQGAVSGQTVSFLDASGMLQLSDPAHFASHITGFRQGDEIVLPNATVTSSLYTAGTLTLGGTFAGTPGQIELPLATMSLATMSGAAAPRAANDGRGNVLVTVPCFCAGTRIATPDGDRAVEQLRTGDLVETRDGPRPIVWIGERHVTVSPPADCTALLPVCIARGALAEGVPGRDLRVSPDHALFFEEENVLIPAKILCNGATIVQRRDTRAAWYLHVELADHGILLAEGAGAESYRDTGNRATFANAAGFSPRPGAPGAYAPILISGAKVEAVRARLLARALALGHSLTDDPDPRIVANGFVLHPQESPAGRAVGRPLERYVFILPAGSTALRLVTRAAQPADVQPCPDDRRVLGISVAGVLADGNSLALEGDAIGPGWHPLERDASAQWRWTSGCACLTVPRGTKRLEIVLQGTLPYRLPQTAASEAA